MPFWSFIFCILITKSLATDHLRDDNTSIGIFIKPYDSINLHIADRFLTFSIDISIFNDLMTDRFNIIRSCHSKKALTKILIDRLQMMNKVEQATKNNPLPYDILVPVTLKSINLLLKNVDISERSKCKFKNIQDIIEKITKINLEVNKLLHYDHSSIYNLIPNSLIKSSIEKIINSYNTKNIFLPFDHSNIFLPDLYENVRYTLTVRNNKIFITYKIPIYEKRVIHMFFTKPFLFNAIPFLLKTDSQFAILNSDKSITFNENALDNNCFDYNGLKYCNMSNITNECDSKYVNEKNITEFNSICFKRLPEVNIATQFSKNVFYTIFSPITIGLTCGNKTIKYLLDKPKVLEHFSSCELESSFFDYERHPTEFYHKIHFSSIKSNSKANKNTTSQIIYNVSLIEWLLPLLIIIAIVLIIFIIFIIYLKCKRNNKILNDKIYFYMPTKAIDTEV